MKVHPRKPCPLHGGQEIPRQEIRRADRCASRGGDHERIILPPLGFLLELPGRKLGREFGVDPDIALGRIGFAMLNNRVVGVLPAHMNELALKVHVAPAQAE
jgi:hypothetical protein